MSQNLVVINPKDNIGVVISEIKSGDRVSTEGGVEIIAKTDVPKNHKITISTINKNDKVIKYGEIIGLATENIDAGVWVHTHNLKAEDE